LAEVLRDNEAVRTITADFVIVQFNADDCPVKAFGMVLMSERDRRKAEMHVPFVDLNQRAVDFAHDHIC
jgi:hypothetical protein